MTSTPVKPADALEGEPLSGLRVAIPESRQLDVLAQMLERRGGLVRRCPLVTILDSPDRQLVENWLTRFNAGEMQDFVIMTGEGLRRLVGFAERAGCRESFVSQLEKVRKITRGPKPGNALRELGLKTDLVAAAPTTEGMIETLSTLDLAERRVSVQLYGEEPNFRLTDFLTGQGAEVITVAPYVYASQLGDQDVQQLIDDLINRELDAIAFTSQPQIRRLLSVADRHGRNDAVIDAMNAMTVIAVGPVVRDRLVESGITVDVMPEDSYFMKPMVRALIEKVNGPD